MPKFLMITRNYPPKLGGLENYSYHLIREFSANFTTYKVVLTKSNVHLFWFFPYALIMALYYAWRYGVKYIHLCDAMLAPLGVLLKMFTKAQVSTSVAGLDITFRNFFYQRIVPLCVGKMEVVICISHATRHECISRGISPDKCKVIPVGINCDDAYIDRPQGALRCELEKLFDIEIGGKILLVTVGRLVMRKGVAWFIENVLPLLAEDYIYFIVGDGPEYSEIKRLIREKNFEKRAFLLGKLSDERRNAVLNAADMFIMPNISLEGDIEGFGIVALEAGAAGLPVIASNIQGIRDAVIDNLTGCLVDEGNPGAFVEKIVSAHFDKTAVRTITKENFDWPKISERYFDALLGAQLRHRDL